jgi:hypothetical protein
MAALSAERFLSERGLAKAYTQQEQAAEATQSHSEAAASTSATSAARKASEEDDFDLEADRHHGQFALRKLYHASSRPIVVLYTGERLVKGTEEAEGPVMVPRGVGKQVVVAFEVSAHCGFQSSAHCGPCVSISLPGALASGDTGTLVLGPVVGLVARLARHQCRRHCRGSVLTNSTLLPACLPACLQRPHVVPAAP